jgi:NAD(P)-dependent dehydrogenase (short-subunit alcohol dehydrogenase family)
MSKVILVTGASSGFGALAVRALALNGHTVYAGMRDTTTRNARAVIEAAAWAEDHRSDLRTVEMDVQSQASVDGAVGTIVAIHGRIDVLVHNAGHMSLGPAEAFTPDQFAELYDINVISTQRVNRAVLPQMRRQRRGLVVWVSSSSARGGTPPYLAPYFAAKAAMDSLAVSYAGELARWGIETNILVPGAFTRGTGHFAHAGRPADLATVLAYEQGPDKGLAEVAEAGLAKLEPPNADVRLVAEALARVVEMPYGQRPFRTHVDPASDGCEVVNGVADRVRAELLRRIGLEDILRPHTLGWPVGQ